MVHALSTALSTWKTAYVRHIIGTHAFKVCRAVELYCPGLQIRRTACHGQHSKRNPGDLRGLCDTNLASHTVLYRAAPLLAHYLKWLPRAHLTQATPFSCLGYIYVYTVYMYTAAVLIRDSALRHHSCTIETISMQIVLQGSYK